MTVRLVAIVGTVLLLSARPHREALLQRKPDTENIQGTWQVVEYEAQDEEGELGKDPSTLTLSFVGKEVQLRFPDETMSMEYHLDERRKHVDFIVTPQGVMPGIYLLDRDRLTIALAWLGGPRPVRFVACTKKKDDWGYYCVLVLYCRRIH
jgi:uncharacterized protein (TIGR03067 family)